MNLVEKPLNNGVGATTTRERDFGKADREFFKHNSKRVQVIVALSQPYSDPLGPLDSCPILL